jgi:hypothetical protein
VTARCIGDQVGSKRRAPLFVAYLPNGFIEGPQGVRIPKYMPQQQQLQQPPLQQQEKPPLQRSHRHRSSPAADSGSSEGEFDSAADVSVREDWLVVLARAAPDKKEWVRNPGK